MKAIWNITDLKKVKKNGYKVFSCFACGGGSTLGYKLAGFDVIGANDVDKKMAKLYKMNHNPKHYFLEDIRTLTVRKDLPKELYELDILDGSPPCSTFSMSGGREKDWGKKKKFTEGQVPQTLDDLFIEFVKLAKELQPKIVIAENVKGMIMGNAKRYVKAIREAFDEAGYDTQLFLLNGANMGVPQRRERIFFIARRKDLNLPKIKLEFKEKQIPFREVRTDTGFFPKLGEDSKMMKLWKLRKREDRTFKAIALRNYGSGSFFNNILIHENEVINTLASGSCFYLQDKPYQISSNDLITIQTFPQDYNFGKKPSYSSIKYVLGMSVPPLMIKGVAEQVKKQLLDKQK